MILAAGVPLAAFVATEHRAAKVRQILGLGAPGRRDRSPAALILVVALLVGLGTAQPVLEETRVDTARMDAQAFFVIDTSRSMLASSAPDAAPRFDRAREAAMRFRDALPTVPVGLASLTDRVLPHVFPTANRATVEATLERALGVDRPPSSDAGDVRATDFDAIGAVARRNFFDAEGRRLVVVFTDAETTEFDPGDVAAAYRGRRTELIVVRFWRPEERVFAPDGAPEPYAPDPASATYADQLASAVGGAAFDEEELAAAIDAARRAVGRGDTVRRVEASHVEPLAPYVFLAALLPLGLLLYRRNLA